MMLKGLILVLIFYSDVAKGQDWKKSPSGLDFIPGRGCGTLNPIKILESRPTDTMGLTCVIVKKVFESFELYLPLRYLAEIADFAHLTTST